jgi:hypothetical protein
MKDAHLTELDIQACAVDISECSASVKNHVESCSHCQMEVERYIAIFSAIKLQPAPANDFDVYSLAMPKVKNPSPERLSSLVLVTAVFSFAFLLIALSFSMIRKANLLIAWRQTGDHGLDYLIIAGGVIILIVYTLSDFKKRREHINNSYLR